jgi:hypothetical protein
LDFFLAKGFGELMNPTPGNIQAIPTPELFFKKPGISLDLLTTVAGSPVTTVAGDAVYIP